MLVSFTNQFLKERTFILNYFKLFVSLQDFFFFLKNNYQFFVRFYNHFEKNITTYFFLSCWNIFFNIWWNRCHKHFVKKLKNCKHAHTQTNYQERWRPLKVVSVHYLAAVQLWHNFFSKLSNTGFWQNKLNQSLNLGDVIQANMLRSTFNSF